MIDYNIILAEISLDTVMPLHCLLPLPSYALSSTDCFQGISVFIVGSSGTSVIPALQESLPPQTLYIYFISKFS